MGRLENIRTVDPVLTTIARGYKNAQFIGDEIFPVVNVETEGGKIPTWGKDHFLVWQTERALKAQSNEMEIDWLNTVAYQTTEHDLKARIDYREMKEAKIKNLEAHAVERVMNAIMLKREKMQSDAAFNLATYPNDNKVTLLDDFWNESAIDWVKSLLDYKEALKDIIGVLPNTCMIGGKVWGRYLRTHPKLKEYVTITQGGTIIFNAVASEKMLSDLLEMNVKIGNSLYTPTKGGAFDYIWGNYIMLAYIVPAQGGDRSVYEPCFGYTLRVSGNPYSDRYPEENGKIQAVRTTDNFEIKVVGAESGFLIKDVIDPAIYTA